MQGLTKPFKCLANGTKIGGNEISSQISRVHLKITPCGRTGVLTSRLWETELLLLGTSLTLICEAGCSYYLTFGPQAVGEKRVWRVFQGTVTFREAQRAGGSPLGWLFKEELPFLVRQGWGQDRLWRSNRAAGRNTALAHSLLWWRISGSEAVSPPPCVTTKSVRATRAGLGRWRQGWAELGCPRCAFPPLGLDKYPVPSPALLPIFHSREQTQGDPFILAHPLAD